MLFNIINMMTFRKLFVTATVVFIILLLLCYQKIHNKIPFGLQASTVDGRDYCVRQDRPVVVRVRAANLLARMRRKIKRFLIGGLELEKGMAGGNKFKRIAARWDGTLCELGAEKDSIAVTSGKSVIKVCLLDDPSNPNRLITDTNSLFYVILHELAHIAEEGYDGHNDEFFETFKYLLEIAIKIAEYEFVDHASKGTKVCGKKLGASPVTCVFERTCDSAL